MIADELKAALAEAATALGTDPLSVTIMRAGAQATPYTPAASPDYYTYAAIDEGVKQVYVDGTTATRMARFVMIDATGETPRNGDKLQFGAWIEGAMAHEVLAVHSEAPTGVALYYRLELSS